MSIHRFHVKCHSADYVWVVKRATKSSDPIEYCISIHGRGDYKNQEADYNCRKEIPSYIWKEIIKIIKFNAH